MDGSYLTGTNLKEKECRQSECRVAQGQRLISMGNWEWNLETREYSWSDEMYQIFNLIPNNFLSELAPF